MKKLILFYALVMGTLLFVIFYYFWKTTGNLDFARTVTFVTVGMNTFFYIFAVYGFRLPVYKLNPFNKYLLSTLVLGMSQILIAVYSPSFNILLHTVPHGLSEWRILIGYGALSIVIYEIGKRFTIAKCTQ
jgi:Ca2+-transporting ATPase